MGKNRLEKNIFDDVELTVVSIDEDLNNLPDQIDLDDELIPDDVVRASNSLTADKVHGSTDDMLQMFLKDVGRANLLTHAEEIELGKRIRKGGQDGQKATDQMVRANLRLVLSIARRYTGQGVTLMDLVQEGCVGLVKAVERYDWRKGFKFSTYATWWIRQAIIRSIANTSRTIRIPIHMADKIRELKTIRQTLAMKLGREPNVKDLAKAMNINTRQVDAILDAMGTESRSLDTPVGEDLTLEDYVQDTTDTTSPSSEIAKKLLSQDVLKALTVLSPKEQRILMDRYGLSSGQRKTLEEIGKAMGYSKERIRQIEARSLKKLRMNKDLEHLREYLSAN